MGKRSRRRRQQRPQPQPKPAPRKSGSRKRPIVLAGAVVAVLGAAAVFGVFLSRRPAPSADLSRLVRPGDAAGYDLLLITLDTVRSDRLGTYGYEKAETPNMDGLVRNGVQFDDAISPVPITLPSHTTIMTGLYPPRHGVRDNGLFRLEAERTTLAERLKETGYDTVAFIGCFVLDERFGLDQGFDTYDFQVTQGGFQPGNLDFNQRSAGAVTDAAIGWLRGRGATATPYFLWVHYFDPHIPLQSPLGNLPRFSGRPYDAEIAYVDQQIGRLVAEIGRHGRSDRTLIALVADHGEGLREHGESTHGLFVYGSTLRVPFILSGPGLFDGSHHVTDRVVSLVDLRPTLEDLLGLPVSASGDGVSLLSGENDPDRALYVETRMPFHAARCSPLYGLRRRHDKYIEAPEPEYYDLRADPDELTNLHPDRSEAGGLAERLDRLRESWAGVSASGRREMSTEEIERLRSLGYAQASGGDEVSGGLPDPKAMMRASRRTSSALRLQREKRLAEAIREAEAAVQECPGYVDGTSLLAELYQEANRTEDAVRILEESLALNPLCGTALQIARAHMLTERWDAMEDALRRARELDPGNGFIHVLRADRFSLQNRLPEALAEYEKALEIDEHRVGMLVRPQIVGLRQQMRQGR
jgi:arylsulfatase A-like enzyme